MAGPCFLRAVGSDLRDLAFGRGSVPLRQLGEGVEGTAPSLSIG